jgi:hypothetical protein
VVFELRIRTVVRVVAALLAATLAASLLARAVFGPLDLALAEELLRVDDEQTLPALLHAALLAGTAGLWWLVGVLEDRHGRGGGRTWRLVGVLFVLLALDESLALHEEVTDRLGDSLGTSGLLTFAWVIPGAVGVAVLAALLLPRVWAQPRGRRRALLLAAALYVGGAIGVEMAGGAEADANGMDTALYTALVHVEEGLEGAGLLVLLHTLLHWVAALTTGVAVAFDDRRTGLRVPGVRGAEVRERDADEERDPRHRPQELGAVLDEVPATPEHVRR